MDETKIFWLSTKVFCFPSPFIFIYIYLFYSLADSEDKFLYVLGAVQEAC